MLASKSASLQIRCYVYTVHMCDTIDYMCDKLQRGACNLVV